MTALDEALVCAARGWHVFPCRADKAPATPRGFKDATCDLDAVRELWNKHPGPAFGIATGASGLVVIDVDVKNGAPGLAAWQELVRELGLGSVDTTVVSTPSGGRHYYYRANGHKVGSTVGKLAAGIDTRGDGGYVIAPGSPGYDYIGNHGPERLAVLPEALAEALANLSRKHEGTVTAPAADVIGAGNRNASLASMAGAMRSKGMTVAAIRAALTAENAARCQPPLPEPEIESIANSISRYEPKQAAPKRAVQGRRLDLPDPEPWPEPVNGAALLDELATTFERFLALPDGASVALALWALHTHCFDAFGVTPRLALCSPEKRCGKTLTLSVLGALVPRALPASNVTAPVVFRAIEKFKPTLLVDEADTFLAGSEELRGVLNSGHTRVMAFVIRTVGDDHDAAMFSTWAPVAVALIGRLPATLEDRSVVVNMRRRLPGEAVERLRLDRIAELEPLRSRAARWAADHLAELGSMDPDIPDLGSDRAADNWRPLLAIADAAGCEWPALARQAARTLQGAAGSDDGSVAALLLSDLRDLFAERGTDRLTSETIVTALGAMEDRPWPEWRDGRPITTRQVARLLKPFGVHPLKYRVGTETARGYRREDLSDPFSRYLPGTGGTPLQNGTFSSGTGSASVPLQKPVICREVPGVPDEIPQGPRETLSRSPEDGLEESA